MTLFVSNFTQKVDAKGRVSIPAAYRAMLQREQSAICFAIRRRSVRRSMPAVRR